MIQPLSYINPGAKIAKSVVIDPFSVIENNVKIGEGTWIGSNVTIMEGAIIGKNCKIYPGSVISAPPQDLKYNGEDTITKIGDNTIIRECVTINKGTIASGKTVIGKNCLLMATVHVAHDCILGDNVILANLVALGGHVEIDDWAIVGGGSLVHQFVKIGRHTMTSGGTLIKKDVPPFVKGGREPMSYVGVNSIGLRRREFSADKIREIQSIYRVIFQSGYNTTKAVSVLEAEVDASEERDEIIQFIQGSQRGIMKGV